MPTIAATACTLPRIPADATIGDIEKIYAARGAAILACDAARQLAVDVHVATRADQQRWLAEAGQRQLPWWRRLFDPDA